ncbi:ribonuclease HI family protein [Candidatus Microgenomates bacterium]|nr:ribonuclease HI family protein [Candidatus Microgenomates bacterium]
MAQNLKIYCDGGSRGNPGPAASAFVVTEKGKVIGEGSNYLGTNTNNVAEYNSVLLAMIWLEKFSRKNKLSRVLFNLDSQLIQRQLTGVYKVKNQILKEYFTKIISLQNSFDFKVIFEWSYRDKNKLADELVNVTLDKSLQRETD